MATEFRLPDIGEGIAEATIIDWLVKEGDEVKQDQAIVKVETDKAVADLPTPVGGKLLKINFKKGDKVNVGSVLCVVGDEGEKVRDPIRTEVKKENVISSVSNTVIENKVEGKILASPAVRKAATERGIDLSKIKGSGQNGQILISDLGEENKPQTNTDTLGARPKGVVAIRKYDSYGYLERIPFKGVRKIIAQNMMKSLNQTAQVTVMEDVDISKLWELRHEQKDVFASKGIKLTFMPFIVRSLIKALQKHPIMNSTIEGEEIILRKYYNIGIAVQTDVGLMVPVLKIVEVKDIPQIAKEIEELAIKTRNRTIDSMELKGSTFTITNYGSVGGKYGTPIINPGEAAILGLGRIFDSVVLDESNGKVRNAKMLPISVTFDHQILDGAQASDFIKTLKELLEDPEHLKKDLEDKKNK